MCGRYVSPEQAAIEREFAVVLPLFERSYNVAPTDAVPVVLSRKGARGGALMRWGLIPFFARGVPPKYSTINARIEALDQNPAWRGAWSRGQRCILPAAGFYEWHVAGPGRKQPFYVHLVDQEIFGLAGLWDRSFAADGAAITSCAIVTMPANELMAEIHNSKQRMPAALRVEDREAWLTGTDAQARAALAPYPSELMVAHPVGSRVNDPKNDEAALIEPASTVANT